MSNYQPFHTASIEHKLSIEIIPSWTIDRDIPDRSYDEISSAPQSIAVGWKSKNSWQNLCWQFTCWRFNWKWGIWQVWWRHESAYWAMIYILAISKIDKYSEDRRLGEQSVSQRRSSQLVPVRSITYNFIHVVVLTIHLNFIGHSDVHYSTSNC